MQLTLILPDDLAQRLQSIPDSNKFVREVLQVAIEQYTLSKLSEPLVRIYDDRSNNNYCNLLF